MSTIKSSTEHLTLNADGSGKDIKFQANGVEKASIDSSGNFTSTSIDATKLSGDLPAIDGASLTGVGKVLQVVQVVASSGAASTTTAFADTGLTATITPSSASSKILVIVNQYYNMYASGNMGMDLRILRDTTDIENLPRIQFGTNSGTYWQNNYGSQVMNKLDSPATTSATTYKTQFARVTYTGTAYACDVLTGSTITLMEIGA
jgi:hypothetical protein